MGFHPSSFLWLSQLLRLEMGTVARKSTDNKKLALAMANHKDDLLTEREITLIEGHVLRAYAKNEKTRTDRKDSSAASRKCLDDRGRVNAGNRHRDNQVCYV